MSDNTPKRDINYKRHTARYRARRRAADILYEAENRDVDPVAIVEDRIALAREDRNAVAPIAEYTKVIICLLYTSPSPRDVEESRMPSSA